jgi:hypothetical protein
MFHDLISVKTQPQVERVLWLDLEDTVITPIVDGWNKFEIINLEKIQRVIQEFEPVRVNVFSFAIWNTHQRSLFDSHCRPHVEKALGVKFDLVPTVDDHIIPAACQVLLLSQSRVDFADASAFWSKQESFRLLLRSQSQHSQSHHVLLDDAVESETFSFPRLKVSGHILNIDSLPE